MDPGREIVAAERAPLRWFTSLNTLRALVKYVDEISDADIPELEIPTGIPLIYELDESLRPLARYYLGNSPVVAQAQEALDHVVRNSGSAP